MAEQTSPGAHERFYAATSLASAIAALDERGSAGAPLAGGTWIMRAPLRGDRHGLSYVAVAGIEALRTIALGRHDVSIGACVSHAELASRLAPHPELDAIRQHARDRYGEATMTLAVTINGEDRPVRSHPMTPLAEMLRSEFFLTGTKLVCGEGFCGSCNVMLDGRLVARGR